ncbi:hypothetical protein ACSX1A_10820 [Pontibacter sp. MBLB2868]|uniref:hypothetical protein n=1 Tax=Pontibacter sp. MBLB2868 TaxID=3451555 RepID=UPI003F7537D5
MLLLIRSFGCGHPSNASLLGQLKLIKYTPNYPIDAKKATGIRVHRKQITIWEEVPTQLRLNTSDCSP